MNSSARAVVLVDEEPDEMEVDAEVRAYDALSQHPRIATLSALARSILTGAASARKVERYPERVAEVAKHLGLTREEASTPFGNAFDVLSRGPQDDAESALACALTAQALASAPPKDREEEDRLSIDMLWLATNTPFDATGLLDRAFGDAATTLWDSVADRIRRVDHGNAPSLGRGEALVGAIALASSPSKTAARQAAALASQVHDPKLARVLAGQAPVETVEPIAGQMAGAPRGPVATALLAMTGLLLAAQGARVLGKLTLGYKRPALVSLADEGGVRVKFHTEVLGRTLRDADVLVPRTALVRATRDVRYPNLAMYAGLLALAVGSYVGIAAFVDGVRAASPSLLASGLLIVALGLGIDFLLTTIAPGMRGRCRLLFITRDGTRLCVGDVDRKSADALLARLASP